MHHPPGFEVSLDVSRIRAISLDLDDTLWPIWPAIERAELAVYHWLVANAPATAQWCGGQKGLRQARDQLLASQPDWHLNLNGLRRESIRWALAQAGDDTALAEPAFEVFFDVRNQVDWFAGARPALAALAARYPVVAVTNGNADVHRMGVGHHFVASLNAPQVGVQKPDAKIFHGAAQAAGVQPHEVLHIGDDALADAWGALQAGMQAVWINPKGLPWPHTPQAIEQAVAAAQLKRAGKAHAHADNVANTPSIHNTVNAAPHAALHASGLFAHQLEDHVHHAHPQAPQAPHATAVDMVQVCGLLGLAMALELEVP